MSAYYNENDPHAAQWLRNLIAAGHIAAGDVDERSVVDVRSDDLRPYRQCHFFAGIGGWSYALRLAGWDDTRPVWTGSCPCQPFSIAGKGSGGKDERHLWPHWFNLIRERKPGIIFGENVEAAIGWGWLDAVLGDLEAEGYATGTAVLGAHSVGAPHIRQRAWFVADAYGGDAGAEGLQRGGQQRQQQKDGSFSELADAAGNGRRRRIEDAGWQARDDIARDSHGLGHAVSSGLSQRERERGIHGDQVGADARQAAIGAGQWDHCEWLHCTDGKARPVEPSTFPLAHGISGRVGRLRAYGNAIVPQVAAEFIRAAGL